MRFTQLGLSVLCSLFGLLFISCNSEEPPKALYTVAVEYINGSKDTLRYKLPIGSEVLIDAYEGTYTLEYKEEGEIHSRELEIGVVRCKTLNIEPLPTNAPTH